MAPRPLLVIDDDVAVVEVITRALAEDGYAVEAATSAPAARRLLETHGREGFGLVMCDALSSPTPDPFAWLDQVRTLTAAPVVIASGYPATAFAGWAERGFAAVLAKPFDLEDLTALVVGLCGRPEHLCDPPAP